MIPPMTRLRISLLAAMAAVAVGCGGERTDISQGVDELNSQVLEPEGARLDCPKEVEGGEGATFDCTLRSTRGGESATVKMKIVEQEGELAVDVADQQQFERAVARVASQG
jgi:hypothetical protein